MNIFYFQATHRLNMKILPDSMLPGHPKRLGEVKVIHTQNAFIQPHTYSTHPCRYMSISGPGHIHIYSTHNHTHVHTYPKIFMPTMIFIYTFIHTDTHIYLNILLHQKIHSVSSSNLLFFEISFENHSQRYQIQLVSWLLLQLLAKKFTF